MKFKFVLIVGALLCCQHAVHAQETPKQKVLNQITLLYSQAAVAPEDGTVDFGSIQSKLTDVSNELINSGSDTKLLCTKNSSYYYITNPTTNAKLSGGYYEGDNGRSNCKADLNLQVKNLICILNSSYYSIYDLKFGTVISGGYYQGDKGRSKCSADIATRKGDLVCVLESSYYYVHNLETNKRISDGYYDGDNGKQKCINDIQ